MSTSDSPVVVLVPGAWHSPSHFDHFTPYLKSAGFEVLSNRNPSCNSSNPTESSVAQDAEAIREKVIRPQVEAGRDVVVVMHSYGGVPGSAAAYGLSKVERAKSGLQGGIIGLIYVAAFTIDEGKTLMTCLPGETPDPWVVPGSSEGNLTVSEPKHAFYNDVSDELAQQAISELHDQTMYSFGTPSPPPAWKEPAYDGRRAYVKTLKDNAIPPETRQQRLLDLTEVEWDVKVMNCGHSPFLNYPEELATWTTETIKKWQAL